MIIEKRNNHLRVISNIYVDDSECFCGRSYICLIAHKEKTNYGWDANTIGIAIHDYDYFDIGLIYKTDTDNYMRVFHELINWMRDHKQGKSNYMDILDVFNFFPDCGCKRKRW